jgi:GNAT superfamily N-acetyltransferase
VDVRVVGGADARRLAAAFPEAPGTPGNRHVERQRRQRTGQVTAIAAWLGERPVGYCVVRWRIENGETTAHAIALGCAELGDLFVAPASRRHGIGRRLVEAAEAVALARGSSRLGLEVTVANPENEAARRLYTAMGFIDAGVGEFVAGYTY